MMAVPLGPALRAGGKRQPRAAGGVGWDVVAGTLDVPQPGPEEPRDQAEPRAQDQPYQALYRRYRPQQFSGVRGQDHVTKALRNAVKEGRVAHAYLFSGPRGTGKTSTARILAMALNCEAPQGGEPDGTCLSCRSVRTGASMDVFELDAASNRKLDEMRDLLSRVALGTPGRWKVYIIDEVHQLTPDAASALLKTLEEPPSHVVFVLATTDPQKVLPTILSRAQHFEFHLLDGEVLKGLLEDINTDAALGLGAEALAVAVEKGRGSARDAESALEQLAAVGESDDDTAPLSELVEALADHSVDSSLQAVARAVLGGREPRRLGNDLVEYLRNAFLAHQAPALVLWPTAATSQLAEQAQKMGLPFLVRCMELLGQALVDMRDSVDPRVTLEVAVIRLSSPPLDPSPSALLQRVERLEREILERDGSFPSPAPPLPTPGELQPSSAPNNQPAGQTGGPAQAQASAPTPGPALAPATSPQGPGPAQAKAALGAILKTGGGGVRTVPSGAGAGGVAGLPPAVPQTSHEDRAHEDITPATAPPQAQQAPAPGRAVAAEFPTRDQLTKAWGDSVIAKLSRPAQVYMGGGRFLDAQGAQAVFALPDRGLLQRAGNFLSEAQGALTAYFGVQVPLRLVVDDGAAAPAPPPADDETYDLDDLSDLRDAPAVPAVPPEQRVLEAFPGSVLDS